MTENFTPFPATEPNKYICYEPVKDMLGRAVLPKVTYNENLFAENVPYNVSLDLEAAAIILNDAGATPEQIRNTSIALYHNPKEEHFGKYRQVFTLYQIEINTGTIFSHVLETAAQEDGFAQVRYAENIAQDTLIHEAAHLGDTQTSLSRLVFEGIVQRAMLKGISTQRMKIDKLSKKILYKYYERFKGEQHASNAVIDAYYKALPIPIIFELKD